MRKLEEMFELADHATPPPNTMHQRNDINALLLMNKLSPDAKNLMRWVDNDEIRFNIDLDAFERIITQEQVNELSNCSVTYSDCVGDIIMYVW